MPADGPPLVRPDLRLYRASDDASGRPRWLIYDPLRHQYFAADRALVARLSAPHAEAGHPADEPLSKHGLLTAARSGAELYAADADKHARRLAGLLHAYAFFRVPLCHPDRMLDALVPKLGFLFSRWSALIISLLAVLAIYLASRQWDAFLAAASGLLTISGAIAFAVAVALVKVVHELGHAVVAKRYGCRVPTLGVAFMLLYPMLYTDVSDAWRLRDARQRMAIAVAGCAGELAVAVVATLLWVFVQDGIARDACFYLAGASWLMSLVINLNPFMKFDGYHLLSDATGIANLHARSSAAARYALRRALFGITPEAPEAFPKQTRRWLIAYAFATWLYRFALFVGIAIVVYQVSFKALGVALFVIEIAYFIGWPILREAAVWWRSRSDIARSGRSRVSLALLIVLLVFMFVPWGTTLRLPAVATPADRATVFAPEAGRLLRLEVVNGQQVQAGDLLFEIRSDALLHARRVAEIRLESVRMEARKAAADPDALALSRVTARELAAARAALDGIRRRIARLRVRAPVAGHIDGLADGLSRGDHVGIAGSVLAIRGAGGLAVTAYADDAALHRLRSGPAHFVDGLGDRARVRVEPQTGTPVGIAELTSPALADVFGGPLATTAEPSDAQGRLVPRRALYRLSYAAPKAATDRHKAGPSAAAGTLHVPAAPQSIAYAIYKQIAFVLMSESGL
ncbi:MAG: site-2 protease family protein [Pseudomonadota bacterium]